MRSQFRMTGRQLPHNRSHLTKARTRMAPTPTDLAAAMHAALQAGDLAQVLELAAARPAEANEFSELLRGLAQQASGQHTQAVATFRRLAQAHPEASAHWNNLGVACRDAGDATQAEQALLRAQSLAPNDAEVHYNLGLLWLQQRRWSAARQALLDAVALAPSFVEARLQAAHACHVCGDNDGQEAMLDGAADWPAQPAEQAMLLATLLSAQGQLAAAMRALEQALLPGGDQEAALRLRLAAQRAALYERGNRLALARTALQQLPLDALDVLPPTEQRARFDGWSAHAAVAMREGDVAGAATLYRRALELAGDDDGRAGAGFGLAAALDRLGRHEQAWQAAGQAHAAQLPVVREVVPELLSAERTPLQLSERTVDRAAYANWSQPPAPDAAHSPVFVVGFPRSGTTLLEQMLDAHPDFRSMDERAFMHELTERLALAGQRYPDDLARLSANEIAQLRALYYRRVAKVLPELGQHRLVDKNPLNLLCLPMIVRLFPQARIVLCLRHPCDVLLSCYLQPFRSPAFMALCSSLPRLAQGYVQAFEQWQQHVETFAPSVLEWRYEAVTERFDEQRARLGEFLDLADPAPLARFAEHARGKGFISTPSYAQVTEGIHRRAVGRWQAYRAAFEPVLPMLRPLLERWGYADDVRQENSGSGT